MIGTDCHCQYKIIDTADNGKNILVCRLCGHRRQSVYGPSQLHRPCPKLRRPPPLAEVLDWVRGYLADGFHGPMLPRIWPEISRRVTACYMTGCEKFNGRLCTDRGTACTKWDRWMERLAVGKCDRWEEERGQGAGGRGQD